MKSFIPEGYSSILSVYDTQKAISLLKRLFEDRLGALLNLYRVSAPLFVEADSGLNDNLNGYERPVSFDILRSDAHAQVVQSLAKWKRLALKRYCFYPGKGLYTDMNAIRRDEDELDNLHSIYVDQWDWEKVIRESERNLDTLKDTVRNIYRAIKETEQEVYEQFPHITPRLPKEITFVHSEDMQKQMPELTPQEREKEYAKKYGAIFVIGIGATLADGKPHDGRAPDYDDWVTETDAQHKGLNGDIIVWDDVLDIPFELSSMGIRVSPESLRRQLEICGCTERKNLTFHKALLDGKLPFSIGGGIGQSRLCMYLLQKAHIGEVQASIWPEQQVEICKQHGILLM